MGLMVIVLLQLTKMLTGISLLVEMVDSQFMMVKTSRHLMETMVFHLDMLTL